LNIVQIVSSPASGGRELDSVLLSKAYTEMGHNSLLICRKDTPVDKAARNKGLQVWNTKMDGYLNPVSKLNLARQFRKFRPDVIDAHWTKDLSNIIVARSLYKRVPLILTKHVYSTVEKKDIFHTWTFKKTDKVLAVSNLVKENLFNTVNVDPEKVETLYNGIDAEKEWFPGAYGNSFRREINCGDDDILIGMNGRLNEGKGQMELVEAMPIITAFLPSAKFVFAGRSEGQQELAYQQKLKERIEELGLTDRVHFAGFRYDLPVIVDSCDLVVMCSRFETFGMVLIESMAMEKPVIGTNAGGVPEIIEDGVNGRLYPPGNSRKLAECVIGILSDRKSALVMGKAGRGTVLQKFNLSKMAKDSEKIYLDLISKYNILNTTCL